MAQNVFITGGSRGIGAAAVLAFAQNGDNVAFVWHSSRQAAEEVLRTAARLAPEGRFLALRADVSDSAAVTAAVAMPRRPWAAWMFWSATRASPSRNCLPT